MIGTSNSSLFDVILSIVILFLKGVSEVLLGIPCWWSVQQEIQGNRQKSFNTSVEQLFSYHSKTDLQK